MAIIFASSFLRSFVVRWLGRLLQWQLLRETAMASCLIAIVRWLCVSSFDTEQWLSAAADQSRERHPLISTGDPTSRIRLVQPSEDFMQNRATSVRRGDINRVKRLCSLTRSIMVHISCSFSMVDGEHAPADVMAISFGSLFPQWTWYCTTVQNISLV